MDKVECRSDGLYIAVNNKEHAINGDFRSTPLSGAIRINYGVNYSSVIVIEVSNTKYTDTKELLDAINCADSNSGSVPISSSYIRLVQYIENQSTATIPVTINSGIIPNDAVVVFSAPTGIMFEGASASKYTINRGTTPHQIELGSSPPVPTNYVLDISFSL